MSGKKSNKSRRLKKELDAINKHADDDEEAPWGAAPEEDIEDDWGAHIQGPVGSPYEDGIFFLKMVFPKEYPFKPPNVVFETKIYHMNVNDDGGICLQMLKEGWTPAYNIIKILEALIALLETPNTNDPLMNDICKQYKEKREAHDEKAKQWTVDYAQ